MVTLPNSAGGGQLCPPALRTGGPQSLVWLGFPRGGGGRAARLPLGSPNRARKEGRRMHAAERTEAQRHVVGAERAMTEDWRDDRSMSSELSPVEHRSWCSPTECPAATSASLTHRARPAAAQSPCGELTVSVQLEQDGNQPPTITMTATYAEIEPEDLEAEFELPLDPGLARAVGWMLLSAGRRADRDQHRTPCP
jgi:hypothetical protein